MLVQAYGAAAVMVVGSILVGHAICAGGARRQRWWAAPAVGLAALIVAAGAAIKLPGSDLTAIVILALLIAAAAAFVLRRGALRIAGSDLAVVGTSVLCASLPFIANGRVGLPGVSLDNDTANFLRWTEALRSSRMAALWAPHNGYPLGPHSLSAAVATALGIPLDAAFTGLLISIVPITALVAAGVVGREPAWRRVVVGLMCALPYLVAAYYGEGAFKETIMAGLLLAFVLHLEQVRDRFREATAVGRLRLAVPAVLLIAGAFYTYSYPGLVWFGLSLALWILAEAVAQPALVREWLSRRRLSAAAPWLVGTAALAILIVLPVSGQALSFFRLIGTSASASGAIPVAALGNLAHPLSPYESLGIWTSSDFRFSPANIFHAGELSAFALVVVAFGVLWSVRRRQLLMPATGAACGLIWWVAHRGQSPYVTAKALVIATPIFMALALRALLTRRQGDLSTRALALGVAAVFCGFAAYSSYQELRNEPVQAATAGDELAAFRHTIGNSSVLFLGDDDYAPWQLRDAAVSALATSTASLGSATSRTKKPSVPDKALDFDSVNPADLNHFRYVITSSGRYASQPPAQFRLLSSAQLYDLWERTGPAVPREVIEPSGAPGAILNCRSATGRKLRARPGVASVMSTPVTVPGPGLTAGRTAAVELRLPAGRWALSLQYLSSFDIDLSAEGIRWTMPAYLGRVGPFFAAGTVTSSGSSAPVTLTIHVGRPSPITGDRLFMSIQTVAATRLPDTRRIVPLSQACGHYLDWYRVR